MHKNFYGWSLENVNGGTVETKYTVEYINDSHTWNRFCKTEDIDLYSKREYDDISKAITFYMVQYVNENCYDIKLWEQVFVNGEMVLEQPIEPESTTKFCLRESINKEMHGRMKRAEQKTETLENSYKILSGFIEMLKTRSTGIKELFEKYMEGNT